MSYRIIGSAIIEQNVPVQTLSELIEHVQNQFGDLPFEYWSENESGEYYF
jgi:hypothetical protein